MPTILAIDQGTTRTKAYRLEEDGRFVVVGSIAHRQFHPNPGWVEHDPMEILDIVRQLIAAAGAFDFLGLANQGETVVAWHARTKRPVHRAIVWQDMRTLEEVRRLQALGAEELVRNRAGLPLDPYFSATKLRWLLDHAEGTQELWARGWLRLGTTDAFLLDSLTGVYATDVSTASRTSLLDLRRLAWDKDLCDVFGVPPDCLPEIRPTVGDFGVVTRLDGGQAKAVASAVDQQAALSGHECRARGDVKITFGTGAFALGLTGEMPHSYGQTGLLPTCAWQIAGQPALYALDGGIYTAAAAIDWLCEIGLLGRIEEIEGFGRPSASERGMMFVPAQAGLGCPFWDRSARGLWIGMDLETSRDDLCRAVVEGVALRAAQLVGAFGAELGEVRRISIDGGLSRSGYFSRFLADALGRSIDVAETPDLTALGIARLVASGQHTDIGRPRASWQKIEPSGPLPDEVHQRFADAVTRSRGWSGGVANCA